MQGNRAGVRKSDYEARSLSSGEDIPEHRNAGKAVRKEAHLNQLLLDAIPCVAFLLRPQTREIIALNKTAVEVGAVMGDTCYRTWAQREDPCPWCLAPELWSKQEPQHIVVEYMGVIWDAHWIPVTEDLYLHYAFDVAERKKVSEEIIKLAKFPAENPNPVLRVAKDGTILYSNKMSRPILELWGCEDGEALSGAWHQMISETLNKRETQETEVEWAGKIYSLTFAPVSDSDFVNVYGLDITGREKAEKEKRRAQAELIERQRNEKEHVEAELVKLRAELIRKTRLAAIGQVSASIAHDLRNPLGSVRNASYFLRRHVHKEDPRLAEYTQIIDEEVAKADQIITNLLEMARPKAPHKQMVDLGGIIKEVFSRAKWASGVRCEMSMVPDPFVVQADPNQLRQVVANIVDNAIEAMKGRGDFFVEAGREAEYDTVVFRDTGPGFAPEIKSTAFEPLVTTKASGTGLGLTICSEIIENHGGSIAVEECEGRGAAVRIRLPR